MKIDLVADVVENRRGVGFVFSLYSVNDWFFLYVR